MNNFLKKYKPKFIDEFIIDNNYKTVIKTLIKSNDANIILIGGQGVGKSTLLNCITNEYYKTTKHNNNNFLKINNLREQGIQFYRNNLKTFCQTKNTIHQKKIVMVDDIDSIQEQSQQVFRNCIDKYKKNVIFIASCSNIQKVIESIQSRFNIIKLPNITNDKLIEILNEIVDNEQINITKKAKATLIKLSNNSVQQLINYLEKIYLTECIVNVKNIYKICTNLSDNDYIEYTKQIIKGDFKKSSEILLTLYENGYSVIDILDSYFEFVKITNLLNEQQKFLFIKMICEYISIFYTLHENKIQLYFFTNKLIQKTK